MYTEVSINPIQKCFIELNTEEDLSFVRVVVL